MSLPGRFAAADPPEVANGWTLRRMTPPSRLFGANGLRTGPDGRLYVAQVSGSQISALDLETGEIESISATGSDIVAPDDLAFDQAGNIYVTEVLNARVSMLDTRGRSRVIRGDIPIANGITMHRGRLFIGECREGGRLLELDLDGGEPRVILDNIPMTNAMEVGPDGLLYFPVMGANEIWRIDPDGGAPETVVTGLGVPDSVKFDAEGYIVSTKAHSGQVLRIDPRTGEKTVLADLSPGLDNLAFAGDRLFVSNFSGEITEVLGAGRTRAVLPGGFNWPLGLTAAGDTLYVADGPFIYAMTGGGAPRVAGMLFTPGYPGYTRGIASSGPGELTVTTSSGQVSRYRPDAATSEVLADGFDQLYGVALAPDGAAVVADLGTGRVSSVCDGRIDEVCAGLDAPTGVAVAPDGEILVAESGAGRVVAVAGGRTRTVLDGLQCPHGLAVSGGVLYAIDAHAKALVAVDLGSGVRQHVAGGLPVGAPPGVIPKPMPAMPPFSGPQGPFTGLAAGPDGTLFVSADTDGSVLALSRAG